jgi:hypothetical protein
LAEKHRKVNGERIIFSKNAAGKIVHPLAKKK